MGLPFGTYEGLALAGFKAEPYRPDAKPGVYEVNFVTRVAGDLVVAPNYEQLFVTTPDLLRILQQALNRLGEKKGARVPLLEELVEAAFGQEEDTAALAKQLRDLVGRSKAKTVCQGAVKRNLRFTPLKR